MTTPEPRYTRNRNVNTDGSGRFRLPNVEYKKPEPPKATRSQSALEYVLFAVVGLLLVFAGVALYTSNSPAHKRVPNTFDAGIKNDRINLLLIGIGGERHPSHDNLADSIMLVSLKPSTKEAAVMSIPRDLWVKIGGYGTHRINYAHAIGEQSGYPGEGPGLMADTVSKTFGQPVNAFVRIDFSAFERVIDNVGGIDVQCQRGFYDFLFKDGFAEGPHHLDGKRALAYARYRYIIGPEGDNFARELRQQQVINALREKLQSRGPQEVMGLVQAASTMSSATETNLTPTQMLWLYRTFHGVDRNKIRHVSLKPFTENFEVTRLAEAGEGVRTKTGDYTQLQAVEKNIFSSEQQIATDDQIRFAGQ
jgi:LCP family protein required for cell wall assembly